MSQFKLAPHSIRYKLFKSFSSSLYGFLLWDMSANKVDQIVLYLLEKMLAKIVSITYRTHNNLLHLISNDQPIDVQLHLRIIK